MKEDSRIGFITYRTGERYVQRIRIRRLEHKNAPFMGRIIQGVLLSAYTRAFETENGLVPPGSVKEHLFDPEDRKRSAAQVRRIQDYISSGSSYWMIEATLGEGGLYNGDQALVKTSPSRPNRLIHRKKVNCYVNDVASKVAGRGLGTAGLYTALTDYPDESITVLDAFEGNTRANGWFEHLGFEPNEDAKLDPFMVGDIPINMIRYEATTGLVRDNLAIERSWLPATVAMVMGTPS